MEKFIVEHTICPSCGVGCGLNIICIDGVPKGIYPYKRHPINEGKNCKNGRDSYKIVENRIKHPKTKKSEISWDDAFNLLSEKINEKDKIGILASGRLSNEEAETLKKLSEKIDAKAGFYTYNIPKQEYPSINIKDIENYKKIILIGDILNENPLLGRRVLHAQDNGAEIIYIGEKSRTMFNADKHGKSLEELEKFECNDSCLILFNKLENENDIKKIVNSGADFSPVFKECNARGVMEFIDPLTDEQLKKFIEEIELLWVMHADPLELECLESIDVDFLVVQTVEKNKTSEVADLVLPTSCWLEKNGTFTNSFGYTQKFSKIIEKPETVLDDEEIMKKFI